MCSSVRWSGRALQETRNRRSDDFKLWNFLHSDCDLSLLSLQMCTSMMSDAD